MDPDDLDIDSLWSEFKATGDQAVRDRLILNYSALVKFVAGRMAVGLPQNVEQADLVSYGVFGLIDAIEKFEPARGFKFETYAISRIKGAILDELRSIDWVPRSVRAKAKSVERAMAKLEGELRRAVDEAILWNAHLTAVAAVPIGGGAGSLAWLPAASAMALAPATSMRFRIARARMVLMAFTSSLPKVQNPLWKRGWARAGGESNPWQSDDKVFILDYELERNR